MFKTLRNAWAIPELRSKILFTLFVIVLYRIGVAMPVPFIEAGSVLQLANYYGSGSIFTYLNILSGDAFSKATLFALSVSPYITAQIVIQLLAVAIPALQKLSKEGEEGQKKLDKITRILTIVLAVITAYGYYAMLKSTTYGSLVIYTSGFSGVFAAVVIIACYTAGAMMIMWLAERIDEQGIGSGISILLFANIVAGIPSIISSFSSTLAEAEKALWFDITLSVLSVLVVLASIIFVVYMSDAERRIPIQYAKRVVGRKVYGGQNSNLPIKLNMSGVMPIIFASTIVSLPVTVLYFTQPKEGTFWRGVADALSSESWVYAVFMFLLIIAFAYFYVSISFDPIEVSNNLMQNGGSIPGIRSGKPTAMYIRKVLNKVVLVGAIFLGIVACVPLIINIISNLAFGVGIGVVSFSGSTLLIVVGVALETVRSLEAQITMRHYKGFLK